jgi:hypothetical protein
MSGIASQGLHLGGKAKDAGADDSVDDQRQQIPATEGPQEARPPGGGLYAMVPLPLQAINDGVLSEPYLGTQTV